MIARCLYSDASNAEGAIYRKAGIVFITKR